MNERKPCCSGPTSTNMRRREMLGYLGGGIGSVALIRRGAVPMD